MNAPLPEHIRKALETVTLDDKYALDYGRAFMSGVQALVKLPMLQRLRDADARQEHGRVHQRLPGVAARRLRPGAVEGRKPYLKAQNIVFQPGVNEELAATALWGTQQLGFAPPAPTGSTACSASGTARARAWTGAPTCSSTPTWPAPRRGAA
jgi:indolepyruvate ferredoxin oxidoreductase